MENPEEEHLSYILNHLGEERHRYYQAVTPPIMQSSNFAFDSVDDFAQALGEEERSLIYTRGNNPTVNMLNQKLAALEGSEAALTLSSGSAAIAAAMINQLKQGDHVVCVQNPYAWTYILLNDLLKRFGVEFDLVDGTSLEAIEAAVKPNTKVMYLESPNSIMMQLQDLKGAIAIAKKHGIVTMVDNSWATPLCQRPIEMGADLVMYSATKYLAGHSDVVAGAICGSQAMIDSIFKGEFMTLGACIAPFNAWLLLRSLRTLPLRVERSSQSTMKVVAFLEEHPAVRTVHYPFSPNHPQYELAQQQMKIPMGLFSITLNTEKVEEVSAFCESLKHFLMAVSWGGHESLIVPSLAILKAHPEADLPANLVRIYVGLEDPDLLIHDLDRALKEISL